MSGASPSATVRSSRPTSWSARSACSARRSRPTSRASIASRGTMFHSADWDDDHDLTGEARRGHRQRRERGAAHPRDRADGRSALPCTSAPRTGCHPRRTPRSPRSSSRRSRADPDAVAAVAQRDLQHHRPQPHVRRRPSGARSPRRPAATTSRSSRIREVRAQAHAEHAVRLQATAGVEPLLPDVQPAERRAGHRTRSPRSPSTAIVTADGTARRGRHDHPRHRLRDHEVPRRARRRRARRTSTSTTRGPTARRPTSASPPPGSRTCSCSTARTPTTARSST